MRKSNKEKMFDKTMRVIIFLFFFSSPSFSEKGGLKKQEGEAYLVKNKSFLVKSFEENEAKEISNKEKVKSIGVLSGWTTIINEGFEGLFPSGSWEVLDNDGSTNGEYYWDDTNYKSHSGGWSAWCAKGGVNWLNPAFNSYPNNCRSWMTYGPFNLSDATDASLSFYFWNISESGYDKLYWLASIDDYNYYGHSIS